jgi:hypothetical protein
VDHPAVEWKTEVSVNFSFPDGLTRLLTRLLGR